MTVLTTNKLLNKNMDRTWFGIRQHLYQERPYSCNSGGVIKYFPWIGSSGKCHHFSFSSAVFLWDTWATHHLHPGMSQSKTHFFNKKNKRKEIRRSLSDKGGEKTKLIIWFFSNKMFLETRTNRNSLKIIPIEVKQ